MARRSSRDEEGPSHELEKLLPDVRRMQEPVRTVVPRPKRRPRAVSGRAPAEPSGRFELLHEGEQLEGRAVGIDQAHLRRLRRGAVPAELTVDLHGLTLREARQELHAALARAWAEHQRCVLVIHGRGSHSQKGPVLKKRLVTWLSESPHGAHIMAFASAPSQQGGAGATYVLLRRPR